MASVLRTESGQLELVTKGLATAAPDCGDATLTALLNEVLESLDFLSSDLSTSFTSHATKLDTCVANYTEADTGAQALLTALLKP